MGNVVEEIPVRVSVAFHDFSLALCVVLTGGFQLLKVVVVNIKHGVLVGDDRIATTVVVEYECFTVMTGQTVAITPLIATYLAGKSINVLVEKIAAEDIVGSGRRGLMRTDDGSKIVHRLHRQLGFSAEVSIQAVDWVPHH